MSAICLQLDTESWSSNRFVISTTTIDADPIIESFAALIATGAIEMRSIQHRYPDKYLFADREESSIEHSYEELIDAQPAVTPVPKLKEKSGLLVQLEAAAETERTQPNDDLAAAE